MPDIQHWDEPVDQSGWGHLAQDPWSGGGGGGWEQPTDDLGWTLADNDPWSHGLDQRLVKFWLRGIEAAERGETLRLETHFEERDRSKASTNAWGTSADIDRWGRRNSEDTDSASDRSHRRTETQTPAQRRSSLRSWSDHDHDPKEQASHELIEKVARRRAASAEMKQKYYEFCNVSDTDS